MQKSEVVEVLRRIAVAMELDGKNPFEIMAFRNGAEHLDDWDGDLPEAVERGTLTDIYGVGRGLAEVISELVLDGRSARYDEMCEKYPESLFVLFDVSGLGISKIKRLNAELGVDSLDTLEAAVRAGRVRALRGFGARTEERILRGIERVRARRGGG